MYVHSLCCRTSRFAFLKNIACVFRIAGSTFNSGISSSFHRNFTSNSPSPQPIHFRGFHSHGTPVEGGTPPPLSGNSSAAPLPSPASPSRSGPIPHSGLWSHARSRPQLWAAASAQQEASMQLLSPAGWPNQRLETRAQESPCGRSASEHDAADDLVSLSYHLRLLVHGGKEFVRIWDVLSGRIQCCDWKIPGRVYD